LGGDQVKRPIQERPQHGLQIVSRQQGIPQLAAKRGKPRPFRGSGNDVDAKLQLDVLIVRIFEYDVTVKL
jgi:hypothetical protein